MDTDIPTVTVLLGHLGYDMSQAEAARRLALVRSNADHNVWVSEENGHVIGLLHAFFRPALDKPPEVIVRALVIEPSQRSKGIGKALLRTAEAWASKHTSATVSLYSAIARKDARRFHERTGYARVATSNLMRKLISEVVAALQRGFAAAAISALPPNGIVRIL